MSNASKPTAPNRAELARQKHARDYRKARRKARDAAGEIKELNITAMMDMMTILLVFLLKSYSASAVNVNMGQDLTVPTSTTQLHPQENVSVSIAMNEISVNDRLVVDRSRMRDGVISAAMKEGGKADAFYVGPVFDALKKEVDKQKYIAKYNKAAPFTGRVNVIADRRIPYRTVFEILYTAGQAELGEYKFMAMKNE